MDMDPIQSMLSVPGINSGSIVNQIKKEVVVAEDE